ncbi:putative type IIS restriction/modification enzyme [Lactococcus cremoris]|nr:putative type IIS restriction/modification enzyme [Lactococcus cremoris]
MISEKAQNAHQLRAVTLSADGLENMSDYVRQNVIDIDYKLDETWAILSQIEQSIKQKIEAVGTPLKEWNIKINRGILTGLNEAFIITKEKRDELVEKDPKSDEIIRPILRGRDISKNSYEWAGLYIIATFPSRHYDIDDFPAVRDYLLTFDKRKLEQSGQKDIDGIKGNNARKKTNNRWFEVQDSIAYWDDFLKRKIVFSRISGTEPKFSLDTENHFTNDTGYIISGEHLDYLLDMLVSDIIWFAFKTYYMGGGIDKEFKVNNLLNLPVPLPSTDAIKLTDEEMKFIAENIE